MVVIAWLVLAFIDAVVVVVFAILVFVIADGSVVFFLAVSVAVVVVAAATRTSFRLLGFTQQFMVECGNGNLTTRGSAQ